MEETRGGSSDIKEEGLNLTKVYESIKDIGLARNPDDLLLRLLQKAVSFCQPEVISFLIKDQAGGDLRYAISLGEKAEGLKDRLVRKGEGVCAWPLKPIKILLSPTPEKIPDSTLKLTDCQKSK